MGKPGARCAKVSGGVRKMKDMPPGAVAQASGDLVPRQVRGRGLVC